MSIKLRQCRIEDARRCGEICYRAFSAIGEKHGFPSDFPSPEAGVAVISQLVVHPKVYGVVAESDGQIVGSNFVDERTIIAGIGPITVDPAMQDHTIGRALMQHVLDRVAERRFVGVRLVQSAYHNRSLSLYTKLGFLVREPLSLMQGPSLSERIPGYTVRSANMDDLGPCNQLCVKVHGHDRGGELVDAIKRETATIIERSGHIAGYATSVGFLGHTIGETNEEVKALIAAAPEFWGPGFLLPTRNAELFRWCLEHGLRVVQPMTLMSIGLYNEPQGAFLPSILY
jgi:GNAT superfamily N-acetyltransferase